jgi:hypothetical protein
LVDDEGNDKMLLRNPANYKAGFWTTFTYDGQPHIISSTEPMNRMTIKAEKEIGSAKILTGYSHHGCNPLVQFEDLLWSKNRPVLLWAHSVKNCGRHPFEDLKTYLLMDFDIGGPKSYKDDMGRYDTSTGLMTVWDDSPLFVQLSGRPMPSAGEVSTPVKLVIDEKRRDLGGHIEMGPRDIVVGIQWNFGDITVSEKVTADVIIASALSLDEVGRLVPEAWGFYDRKMR